MMTLIVAKVLNDDTISAIKNINKLITSAYGQNTTVTVLYCFGTPIKNNDIDYITFQKVKTFDRCLGVETKSLSFSIYEYLKCNESDFVFFINCSELGYYSALAKNEGLNFQNLKIIAVFDNAPELGDLCDFDSNLEKLNSIEMEKKSRDLFDYVISKKDLCDSYDPNILQRDNESIKPCNNFIKMLGAKSSLESCEKNNIDSKDNEPFVSVCIVHYNRPKYLQGLLNCFKSQTYKSFEVILLDDGSDDIETIQFLSSLQESFNEKGWKIIRQENKYLGAARNAAVEAARGEYIVFSDDDNYPMDNELEVFVSVMEKTNADILTCGANLFFGTSVVERPKIQEYYAIPLGDLQSSAFYENVFGDANCCVRKSAFKKIGGFTEDYGIGYEDWEFFLKASMRGFKILVIPEILFWYRVHSGSMMGTTSAVKNRQRVLRDIFESNHLSGVLQLANIAYVNRNVSRYSCQENAIINGVILFIRSHEKMKHIRNFIYSLKHFGVGGALQRIKYYGKIKL